MSSNYPEGSMRGSGIYSEDITLAVECPSEECDFDDELEMSTNDWGTIAYGQCPKCETDIEKEIDNEDDDYDYYKDRY